MARPAAKPALTKAPSRPHPIAPPAEAPEAPVVAETPAPLPAPDPAQVADPKVMHSARIRASLRREVKLHSAATDLSLEEITEAALEEYLERHRPSA